MTGRERVKAALTFNKPDRTPRDLWAVPYIILFRESELRSILSKYPMDIGLSEISLNFTKDQLMLTEKKGQYIDDWGSVWYVGEPGVWGEVKKPVLSDWSALKKFKPPYHILEDRDLSDINRQCEQSDNFMLSHITARPFERLQFLRGTENLFIDIANNSSKFHQLLKMVHEFFLKDIEKWCNTDVDGIFFMDDWGTNSSLLINPKIWREIFKPLYREYCSAIHNSGKFTFFHSDGNIEEIFGDLIEVGVDTINSQLFTMNVEKIASKYKGKITLWGEVDRQYILAFGTPDDACKAVMRVRHSFDNGSGGVIAQCEWGKDNSKENIEAVYKAWDSCLK
jgi:hypothetical protein